MSSIACRKQKNMSLLPQADHGRRLAFGVTVNSTAEAFLRGQLAYFSGQGWDVYVISGESGLEAFGESEGVSETVTVPAVRDPNWRDPLTLIQLCRTLRTIRPHVVVMGTPKMGVFGVVASRLVGVPRRVYLVHGYRADGLVGAKRRVMRLLERLACAAATDVVAVSQSLRRVLIDDGAVHPKKVVVLGSGSANGVDLQRFVPATAADRAVVRARFSVPADVPVVVSVGRIGRDKGLQDMPEVWRHINAEVPNAWLLLAGGLELADADDRQAWERLRAMDQVRYVGHLADVEQVYQAGDILMFATRREGLGMVALEAAACQVPTVGFAATGVVDAVIDGATGVLVSQGDANLLAEQVVKLLRDPALRQQFGAAAGDRVRREFAQEKVWSQLARHLSILGQEHVPEAKCQ